MSPGALPALCAALLALAAPPAATKPANPAVPVAARRAVRAPLPVTGGPGRRGALFPAERGREALLAGQGVHGFWDPGPEEIERIEAELASALDGGSRDPGILDPTCRRDERRAGAERRTLRKILGTVAESRRQYLGVRVGRHRRVWINVFPEAPASGPDPHEDWRERFVRAFGDGDRYWTIQYDADRGFFTAFRPGGV